MLQLGYDAVKIESSRCYCWTELLQKEEMVAKEHPLSPLLLLDERMLDDSCMLTVHGEGVAAAVHD